MSESKTYGTAADGRSDDKFIETAVDRLGDNDYREELISISYKNSQVMLVMSPSSKSSWMSLASMAARLWLSVLCNCSWLGQMVRGRVAIVVR